MMNKKDSLNLLQNCIDRIANVTEEDIEMFRMKYDIHCMDPLASSEFKFISPTDLESSQVENVEEVKLIIIEKKINGYYNVLQLLNLIYLIKQINM